MARTWCSGNGVLGAFGFLILIGATGLVLASLFTHNWLEEKFEFSGSNVYSYYLNHGLYEICTKKYLFGQRVHFSVSSILGLKKPEESPQITPTTGRDDFVCMSRFDRKCLETQCERIDGLLSAYHENVKYWEIVGLSLMCVSCALSLLVLIAYLFLCLKCPSILAVFTLLAASCSCATLILFSMYHGTTRSARDNVFFNTLIDETNFFGYSFWLAVGGCAMQFLASILLSLQTVSLCCWRNQNSSRPIGEL